MTTNNKNRHGLKEPETLTVSSALGNLLLERQLITAEELDRALNVQQQDGGELEDILLEQDLITSESLLELSSLRLGVPLIDLKQRQPQPEAIQLIPEKLARKYNVLPLEIVDGCLLLVMANAEDLLAYQDAESVSGMRVIPAMAAPDDIKRAIEQNYKGNGQINADIQNLVETQTERKAEKTSVKVEGPLDRVIETIIFDAVRDRASDILIEPQRERLRIRCRIDGVLHEVQSLPIGIHPAMLSWIKVRAKMNITERRRPQDGHFNLKAGEKDVDIRVATYSTAFGEMATLRLLNREFTFIELEELGFNPWSLGRFEHLLRAPYGIILIAGPTGSGKTTTLYASVNRLKQVGCNILTIEDPIEYEFDGVNHGQVNQKAGLTFAAGIRSMLRLDPDIIVVGEIRDRETAQMAVEAALTGCLVLSSIHAGDAARVFSRMLHLGVEPYLLASSVVGVVAQRVVRRVCSYCRKPAKPTAQEKSAFEKEMNEELVHYQRGAGCNLCAHTGYLGRIGLFEVMLASDAIQQMLAKSDSPQQIETQAIKEGMMSMRTDGMTKVKEGTTTPSEVIRSVFSIYEP